VLAAHRISASTAGAPVTRASAPAGLRICEGGSIAGHHK
jgi:hypothetical protein